MTKQTIYNIRRMCPLGSDMDEWIASQITEIGNVKSQLSNLWADYNVRKAELENIDHSIRLRQASIRDSCKHYDVVNRYGQESCDNYTECGTCGKILEVA